MNSLFIGLCCHSPAGGFVVMAEKTKQEKNNGVFLLPDRMGGPVASTDVNGHLTL